MRPGGNQRLDSGLPVGAGGRVFSLFWLIRYRLRHMLTRKPSSSATTKATMKLSKITHSGRLSKNDSSKGRKASDFIGDKEWGRHCLPQRRLAPDFTVLLRPAQTRLSSLPF